MLEDAESSGQAEKHWPNLVRHRKAGRTWCEAEQHRLWQRLFHLERLLNLERVETQSPAEKHWLWQRPHAFPDRAA